MPYPVGVTAVDQRNGPSKSICVFLFISRAWLSYKPLAYWRLLYNHLNCSVGYTLTIRQHLKSEQKTILIVRQCWESYQNQWPINQPASLMPPNYRVSLQARTSFKLQKQNYLDRFVQFRRGEPPHISLPFPFRLLLIFIIQYRHHDHHHCRYSSSPQLHHHHHHLHWPSSQLSSSAAAWSKSIIHQAFTEDLRCQNYSYPQNIDEWKIHIYIPWLCLMVEHLLVRRLSWWSLNPWMDLSWVHNHHCSFSANINHHSTSSAKMYYEPPLC